VKKDKLISASSDKTIKVWDILNEYKCIANLFGHTDSISHLKVDSKDHLVSCSEDWTVKVWDLEKFECVKTLKGHNEPVFTVQITSDDNIISASGFCVKVWDGISGECLNSIELVDDNNFDDLGYDQSYVRLISDDLFVAYVFLESEREYKLKLFRTIDGECVYELDGEGAHYYDMKMLTNGDLICSFVEDKNFEDEMISISYIKVLNMN
jgi:WD40 repeat protein